MPVTASPALQPAGALAPAELAGIAARVADAGPLWASVAVHDPHERRPVRLLATGRYEVWVIGWCEGQGVAPHDHGRSLGALAVVAGSLRERAVGGPEQVLAAGATVELPAGVVHEVHHAGTGPATSIHVYSPPLSAMTHYDPATGEPVHLEVVDEPALLDVAGTA